MNISIETNPDAGLGKARVPGTATYRRIFVALTLVSLVFAWAYMAIISRIDPWYRNTDMNIHNMVDALSINSDASPNGIDQPGVPLKTLLALDYRIRHYLGLLPVWNMKKFGARADPLRNIPPLIRIGRVHSRILVLVMILCAGGLIYTITREVEAACFAIIVLCGSSGVLFHGLLTRPELLCVGFGNVLGLLCVWQATASRSRSGLHLWLFLAGLCCGLSALTKLPGVCYLGLCYGWCWVAAVLPDDPRSPRPPPPANFWAGLLPVVACVSMLGLLFHFTGSEDTLGSVVLLRLRVAAVLVGVLPLLALWTDPSRRGKFLLDRISELVLLVAGALAAIVLCQLLLCCLMTEASASNYMARTLHFLVNPAPTLKYILVTKPDVGREFVAFLKDNPVLFLSTALLTAIVWVVRSVPAQLKAFIGLLWISALGMTLVMSRRQFFHQYSIFPAVPLLLVWPLGLVGLEIWWRQHRPRSDSSQWMRPLIVVAAFVISSTVYFRLEPTYTNFHDDAALPVNDLTLTFLFDHDVHPQAYLKIMKDHYGDRKKFAEALQRFLADPANRY